MRFPATSINTVLWPIIVIFMDEYSGAVTAVTEDRRGERRSLSVTAVTALWLPAIRGSLLSRLDSLRNQAITRIETTLICKSKPVSLGGLLERETDRRCALLPSARDLCIPFVHRAVVRNLTGSAFEVEGGFLIGYGSDPRPRSALVRVVDRSA